MNKSGFGDAPITDKMLCKNEWCMSQETEHPKLHRHTTADCYGHQFCKSDKIPAIVDTHDNIALMGAYEHNSYEFRKLVAEHTKNGGPMSIKNLQARFRSVGHFGNDPDVPQDRKVVNSEEAVDAWLAAHYGISLDSVPAGRPPEIKNPDVWKFIKSQYFGKDGFYHVQEAQKRKRKDTISPINRDDSDDENNNKGQKVNTSSFSNAQYQYQISPERHQYKPVTYPKEMEVKSIAQVALDEEMQARQQKQFELTQTRARGRASTVKDPAASNSAEGGSPVRAVPAKVGSESFKRAMTRGPSSAQLQIGKGSMKSVVQFNPDLDESRDKTEGLLSVDEAEDSEMEEAKITCFFQQAQLQHSVAKKTAFDIQNQNRFQMTKTSSVQISESRKYTVPAKEIRNRLLSPHIEFLNYQEIEQTAHKQTQFKQNYIKMKEDQRQLELQKEQLRVAKSSMLPRKPQGHGNKSHGQQSSTINQDKNSQIKDPKDPSQQVSAQREECGGVDDQAVVMDDSQLKQKKRQAQNLHQFEREKLEFLKRRYHEKQEKNTTNKLELAYMSKIRNKLSFRNFTIGEPTKEQGGKLKKQQATHRTRQSQPMLVLPSDRAPYNNKKPLSEIYFSQLDQNSQGSNSVQHFVHENKSNTNSKRPSATGIPKNQFKLQFKTTGDFVSANAVSTSIGSRYHRNAAMAQSTKHSNQTIFGKPSLLSTQRLGQNSGVLTARTKHSTNAGGTQKGYVTQRFQEKASEFFARDSLTSGTARNSSRPMYNTGKAGGSNFVNGQSIAPQHENAPHVMSMNNRKIALKSARLHTFQKQPAAQSIKNSLSTSIRIKQERVTSAILKDQADLQKNLNHNFGINTSEVQLPAFTQVQNLATPSAQTSTYQAQPEKVKSKKFTLKRKSQSQEPKNIPKELQVANEVETIAQGKYKNEAEKEVNVNDGEQVGTDLHSQDPAYKSSVRFSDIKNKFGIPNHLGERASNKNSAFEEVNMNNEELTKKIFRDQDVDNAKLTQQILRDLNEDSNDKKLSEMVKDEEQNPAYVINFQIQFILFDLCQNSFDKDFKDYRFWLRLSQKRIKATGSVEAGLDYLRNGLREIPLNPQLLYNFACANERLNKFNLAIKFFQYACQIKARWTDALFGEAVCHFKVQDYKNAKRCIKKAIAAHDKKNSLEDREVLQYFQAMCYRKLKKYKHANRDYGALAPYFKQQEGTKILNHVVGLVMLPLKDNRQYQIDFIENTMQLLRHFQNCEPQAKNRKLSMFVDKCSGYLNMDKYGVILTNMLKDEPFFRRFDVKTLQEFLAYAKPQYYKKDEIVFIDDRVGVITFGSVRIQSHSSGLLKPFNLAKYTKGKILGHDSDNGITNNPQNWIITYDTDTEILMFDTEVFEKLWKIQFLKTDRQIIEANIECNQLLKCLSDQSQYQIIYEDMQIRKFRPGQLICRMSKQSHLNRKYAKLRENRQTNFMDDVGQAQVEITVNNMAKRKQGEDAGGETIVSGFFKQLTKKKTVAVECCGHSDSKPQPAPLAMIKENLQKQLDAGQEQKEADILESNRNHPQYIDFVDQMYKDCDYKEVDGIYIVYQGNVDILSTSDKRLLHQINIFETFGESTVLKDISYEYYGDLYAGLHPRNPFNSANQSQEVFNLGLDTQMKKKLMKSESMKKYLKGKNDFEKMVAIMNQVTETDDLNDIEDCTLCLYIPYSKFMTLPTTEIKKIKENATLKHLQPALIQFLEQHYAESDDKLKDGLFKRHRDQPLQDYHNAKILFK